MPIRERDDPVTSVDVDQAITVTEQRLERHRAEQHRHLEAGAWSSANGCEQLILSAEHWLVTLRAYRLDRFGDDPARTTGPSARLDQVLEVGNNLHREYQTALALALNQRTVDSYIAAELAYRTLSAFRHDAFSATGDKVFHQLGTPRAPSMYPEISTLSQGRNPRDQRAPIARTWSHLLPAPRVSR